jgi:hypothetical protein
MAENAHAYSLEMPIVQHTLVYESQMDAIRRYRHVVNFHGNDVALPPCTPSSSSSSASIARSYWALSLHGHHNLSLCLLRCTCCGCLFSTPEIQLLFVSAESSPNTN